MPKEESVAYIAVEKVAYHFDKPFTYRIPDEFIETALPGCRVMVPFGRGSRRRLGIILGTAVEAENQNLKTIVAVLDQAPLLNVELLKLVTWLKEQTFCTLFEAAKIMLPSGINLKLKQIYELSPQYRFMIPETLKESEREMIEQIRENNFRLERDQLMTNESKEETGKQLNRLVKEGILTVREEISQRVGNATIKMARLCADRMWLEEYRGSCTVKQNKVIDFLSGVPSASVKEITYFTGVGESVVGALHKKGIVEFFQGEVYRDPYRDAEKTLATQPLQLTSEQQSAFDGMHKQLQSGAAGCALLFGVTGSGKTQIFLRLIDEVLEAGKSVIVMVPEIALTPQTISIFHRRYGSTVAVFHSGLSLGERFDEWKRVKNGKANIVVGTRSAVFAPLENLGLIIMDEEHEQTYKSEKSPRFHARDVARFRCAEHKALLLLASATPSVESYAAACGGRYQLYTLKKRYGNAILPEVITADMSGELASGNRGAIGIYLQNELSEVFEQKKQSILLLNRRGYHTHISCVSCKTVLTCPHCSISLTYHAANRRLMCHYCGYSTGVMECPACHERKLRFSGVGTQRIEEELTQILPQARILRLDADTTMTRSAFEKQLKLFAQGEYDILLGTQMVAKGLNFERVTLVGVISVDSSLFDADYRASERTFSLLTQVVGRSGRGEHKGKAVIQTFYPDNPIIQMASMQDYEAFYGTEIKLRKLLTYPPYCDLCVIGITAKEQSEAEKAANAFLEAIKRENTHTNIKMIVLGPSPARVVKVSDSYRYHLTVKCKNDKIFRTMMSKLLCEVYRDTTFQKVKIAVDINPYNL